jgi:hypothetical protein
MSVLHESLKYEETIEKLRESYISSLPYNHVVINSLCADDVMKEIQKEVVNNILSSLFDK